MPMLMEDERQQMDSDPWLHLHNELANNDRRRLFVVPSTKTTLDRIADWSLSKSRPILVGQPTLQGLWGPNDLLSMLKGANERDPGTAIVFSDQLTSAADAPMLIEKSGRLIFVSAIEVIAHCNYQFEIHAWTGNGFEAAPESSKPEDILLLLYKYFTACEDLGRDWSAAGHQADRYPRARIAQAQIRLQMLQSTVMHTFSDSALPTEYQAVVEKIMRAQKNLSAETN